VGLACFIIAAVNSDYDADHKKQNDINYIQNLDTETAYWFSRDHAIDTWTRQFLGTDANKGTTADIERFGSNLFYNKARYQEITSPAFEVTADSSSDSLRFLSVNLDPRNDGIGMRINWDERLPIAEVNLDSKQIFSIRQSRNSISEAPNNISYFKDLSAPTEISLAFNKNVKEPILSFTFISQDLPTHLISNYEQRSADMMPKRLWFSNASFWKTEVNLDSLREVSE
jgi:hypothetical protein